MIAARPGLVAAFKVKSTYAKAREEWVNDKKVTLADGESIAREHKIEAWDDDGAPMIIGDNGKLKDATEFSNFLGVVESESDVLVQLIPAQGWRMWWRDEDSHSSDVVAAFGLTQNGTVKSLIADGSSLDVYAADSELRHESDGPPPPPKPPAPSE